jgi:hypothetical protein
LRGGERPTDAADKSPFTGTYVRKLAREAGVPEYLLRRYPKARAKLGPGCRAGARQRRRSANLGSGWMTPSTSAACCGTA